LRYTYMRQLNLNYLLLSTCLIMFANNFCFSQIQIRLHIKDKSLGFVISSANVTLVDQVSQKSLKGSSDSNGQIEFTVYPNQKNVLNITYIGYKPYLNKLEISADTDINIYLEKISTDLAEVNITSARAALENRHDRLVYRVNPKSSRGKKIVDIMKNIPFVAVTIDQLTVKGSTDYIILKNGNPSNLTLQDLRLMPASRIDSIELVTSPSAQYDGNLKSIINIIFKKDDAFKGGTFFSRAGTRSSSIGSAYSNTTGTHNTNLNVDLSYDRNLSGSSSETKIFQDTLFETKQIMTSKNKSPSFLINYTREWDIGKEQFLGIGAKVGMQKNTQEDYFNSEIYPNQSKQTTNNTINTHSLNTSFNGNYSRQITKSSKINFANQVILDCEANDLKSSTSNLQFNNRARTINRQFTSQLDYQYLFKKGFKTEVGAKLITRFYHMLPTYNEIPGEELNFNQIICGGYLSVSKSLKHFYMRLGTRIESTRNKFGVNDNSTVNLLPNLLLTYDITENHGLKLVYRESLSRPSFRLLSNFIINDNPLNTIIGNPSLANENFKTASLEDNLIIGNKNLSLSLSYVEGRNLISSKRGIESFKINTFYGNFSKSKSIETYLSFNSPLISDKLSLSLSGSLKTYSITDGYQRNSGLIKDLNTSLSFNPSQAFSLDLSANYLGNFIYLQGKTGNSIFMDIMARYQHKKSSFLIQLTNPVINKINQSAVGSTTGFLYAGNSYYLGRSIAIAYAFTFGKSKDEVHKTNSIENKDIKQEKHL